MDKQTFIQKARELLSNYQPSQNVQAQLARLDLIGVVGPTGVGKTTIIERSNIPYVLSDVTRLKRDDEVDGKDYHFRTNYDRLWTEIESGRFVQYVVSDTDEFYGTRAASYPDSGACTMAIYASVIPVFKTLGFRKVVSVYIVPPSYAEWMQRIGSHEDENVSKRLKEAKESLELGLADPHMIFMINGNLEAAINQFMRIAAGENMSDSAQKAARDVAASLLDELSANIQA